MTSDDRCQYTNPETLHRCDRVAAGSMGRLRMCAACVAEVAGLPVDDPRLAMPARILLTEADGRPYGESMWIPDAAVSARGTFSRN